ncbi:histidine kinase [Streptomyces sp. NBC_01498]|uniref:sensor histidine kinase n=1 Tax=Streptomyces sp. NBC_01498 TaxID=2975870 RepID=UPI002E7B6E72|nr:histidine kinase [Streptomyces sp. NBC_01498]WTL23834.1 histidine kinase [Streptomyces sp. NBC_01498]
MTRTEYSWLLPSAMAGPAEHASGGTGGVRRPRRTVRDWAVDLMLFLFAAFVGMLALDAAERAGNDEMLIMADLLIGLLACCTLWVRRSRPLGLTVCLVFVQVVAPTASGAVLVALVGLAVHRPVKPVAYVAGLALVSMTAQAYLRPDPTESRFVSVVVGALLVLLALASGMLVRSRRQLVLALRERAVRAETEAALRAEQAQRLAREAIAREMHDVLAHRLSLLSVHAGGLEFRPDAPPAEVARAAGVIRDSAHEALQDLRTIIGVLRAPGDEGERPQPTLATLDALVEESREAGMNVTLDRGVADPAAVSSTTGRTAYRIAQEGLTNARKHAPGTATTVLVSGGPGDGLTVEVRNEAPRGPVPDVPGSGQGLIGLTERATLAGGRFEHGPTGDGGFAVRAWLPWSP